MLHRQKRCKGAAMSRLVELEADNTTLISIIEKNIETMRIAANLLSLLQNYEPAAKDSVIESIEKIRASISSCREFLGKLYQEGNYPQQ